jgi:hypothetical protein
VRFTRGFLAGLGAATSLVLAGSLALLALSTVVAFKGWPELRSAPPRTETASLAISAATTSAASAPVVPLARPRRTGARGHARPSSRRVGVRPTTDGSTSRPAGPFDRPDTQDRGTARNQAASQPSQEKAEPEPGERKPADAVRETTKPLADGVRDLTDGLGDTLEPASPTLNETVDGLGQTLGTTVEGLGEAVGNVVDGLLGKGPRTP